MVSALDKLEEPPTLVALREAVKARLPRVDLPEILLEMAGRTGFTEEFTHLSEREAWAARPAHKPLRCADGGGMQYVASPPGRSEVPALRWSRLVWVTSTMSGTTR